MSSQAAFYREVFGLNVKNGSPDKDWIELAAGSVSIGLHGGGSVNTARRPPKIVFYSDDVESARDELMKRGVKMGKVVSSNSTQMCDGKDQEGNAFQISNRE